MSKPTFDEEYTAKAREIAEAATPRPWFVEGYEGTQRIWCEESDGERFEIAQAYSSVGDGDYIALAANDFPAALAEVASLRAALQTADDALVKVLSESAWQKHRAIKAEARVCEVEAENVRLRAVLKKPVSRSLGGVNWVGFTAAEWAALAGEDKS